MALSGLVLMTLGGSAGVSHTVAVAVRLIGVSDLGAVVLGVRYPVVVAVGRWRWSVGGCEEGSSLPVYLYPSLRSVRRY